MIAGDHQSINSCKIMFGFIFGTKTLSAVRGGVKPEISNKTSNFVAISGITIALLCVHFNFTVAAPQSVFRSLFSLFIPSHDIGVAMQRRVARIKLFCKIQYLKECLLSNDGLPID